MLGPSAMVLVPTRELCQQVHSELSTLLKHCGGSWKAVQLTSGMSPSSLRSVLSAGPDIIISTPACVAMCIMEKFLRASTLQESLSTLVLDEADLLLSYGYEDDIRSLAPHVPRKCQCLLMSATSSADVEKLKKLVLHNPVTLTLTEVEGKGEDDIIPDSVQQFLILCKAEDKLLNILALLHLELVQKKVLIFVNTIDTGFRLKLFLEQFGVRSAVLNAQLPQNSRLHILQEFNLGLFDYLIATDDSNATKEKVEDSDKSGQGKMKGGSNSVGKKKGGKQLLVDSEFGVVRGIDFKNVRTVINFDMPRTPSNYVHRIGRTGRAQSTGASISLVSTEEEDNFTKIRNIISGGSENGDQKATRIVPFPSLTKEAVESLRYRAEDVARGVTKVAIKEARAKELRLEILNSEKLKAHFEDHPTDLELLKHDKVLSKRQPLPHLKTVPEYMRDPTTEAASKAVKMARAAMGHLSGFKRKRKSRSDDPLKSFSVNAKKRKSETGGVRSTLWARKNAKKTGDKPRDRKKKKHRRHK